MKMRMQRKKNKKQQKMIVYHTHLPKITYPPKYYVSMRAISVLEHRITLFESQKILVQLNYYQKQWKNSTFLRSIIITNVLSAVLSIIYRLGTEMERKLRLAL